MSSKMQKKSPIKQRILHFVDTLNISRRDFYAITGISRGTLESSTSITEDTLAKFIAIYHNVNPVWLLSGASTMLLPQPSVSEPTECAPPPVPPPKKPPGACAECLLRDKIISSLEQTVASQQKTIATLEESLKEARQPHGQKRKAG
jgi:hypothetical protein